MPRCRDAILLCCMLAALGFILLGPLFGNPTVSRIARLGGLGSSDRVLPNQYRLRPLEWNACRIKHGPEHVVLPTTDRLGTKHGILELAIMGDVVVGPVVNMATPGRDLVGWFWLDTRSDKFAEGLTKAGLEAYLAGRGLALPPVLTHVSELDEIPWGE